MLKNFKNNPTQLVNHKYLRKVKKNWVVFSILSSALIGGALVLEPNQIVNADATATSQPANNIGWAPTYKSGKADTSTGGWVFTPGYTVEEFYWNGKSLDQFYYKLGEESGLSLPSELDTSDMEATPTRTVHFRNYSDRNNANAKDIATYSQKSNQLLYRFGSYDFATKRITSFGEFGVAQDDGSGLTNIYATNYDFNALDLTDLSQYGVNGYTSPVDQNGHSISSIATESHAANTYDKAVSSEKYGSDVAKGHTTTSNDVYVYLKN